MNSSRDNKTTDANETDVTDSQLRSQKVADILAFHMGAVISTSKMEEPALIIGKAQTGKSVLVNAFCGVKFIFNDAGRLKPLSKLVTPIGDEENGSFDCTVFPGVHFSEMLNEHLIDTPGYLGVDELELKIAKEQSIRLIIQNASKVKIVFLVDCNDLANIQNITRTVVEILGNLHIGDRDNIPIYLLLNRYVLTQGQMQKYCSLSSEEGKSKFVFQNVHEKLKGAVGMIEEYCRRLNKRLDTTMRELKESGKSDDEINRQLQNNADFQEMIKSLQTVMFLMNTLENNSWGYFDPTDMQSIEQTVQGIRGMRSVDSNAFDFTMHQNEWVLVKRFLEEKLLEYKEWMVGVKMNEQYPKAFFEHCESILDHSISERSNELKDWKNKRNVPALTEKYNSEIGSQINDTKKEIDAMREEVEKLSEERKSMENKIVVLYEERWNKEGTLFSRSSHIVTYPYSKAQGYPVDIPIIDRKIDISEPTKIVRYDYRPEEAVSITEFHFVSSVDMASVIVKTINVIDGALIGAATGITSLLKAAKLRLWGCASAVAGGAAGAAGAAGAGAGAVGVGAAAAAGAVAAAGVVCAGVAAGVVVAGAAVGAVVGGIEAGRQTSRELEAIKAQTFTGTVIFYGKESDKEWATYEEKRNMINAYEKEIAKKEQELNDLCVANESSVEKKLQNSIDASERQKEELSSLQKEITDRIESSPQEVRCAVVEDRQISMKTMSFAEKLELVYRFCKMLAVTTETTEHIKTFITMYEELQEPQKHPISSITPTLETIPILCSEMCIELKKCGEAKSLVPLQQQQLQEQQNNRLMQKQSQEPEQQLQRLKKQQKQPIAQKTQKAQLSVHQSTTRPTQQQQQQIQKQQIQQQGARSVQPAQQQKKGNRVSMIIQNLGLL